MPPNKKSVEEIAGGKVRAPRTGARQRTRKKPARRSRVTKVIQLAQQIVLDRDTLWLTWTEIAVKHGISETTAYTTYYEYTEEIAPLLTNEVPKAVGEQLLRKLQGIQQRIAEIAGSASQDTIRLGALNSLAALLQKEIELRQHLGLLPKKLGDITLISDQLWAAEQIVLVLRSLEAPPDAFRRVAEILEVGAAPALNGGGS